MKSKTTLRRIGITMRVAQAQAYVEQRDALAHDWGNLMRIALPQALWMPLPNLGRDTVRLAEGWGVNALIFSGGDNPGDFPERDETEAALFHWAAERRLPLFGVCRGFQVLVQLLGGGICPCEGGHIGSDHEITLRPNAGFGEFDGRKATVNSFHQSCVREDNLGSRLVAFAHCSKGFVEGAVDDTGCVTGVMWHPERFDRNPRALDLVLMRRIFERERT